MHVSIIGGGLSGLIIGYYLSKKNYPVTIFEKEEILGGAASCFEINGQKIEKFYHHSLGSDYELFEFLDELGLKDILEWEKAGVGFYCDKKIYNWDTPFDFLKFSPLSFLQKIRFGWSLFYISKIERWKRLESIRMNEWLVKLSGKKVYETIWEPMIKFKWGKFYSDLPATWIWRRVKQRVESRTKLFGIEKLGYLKGSTQTFIDFLEKKIIENNGKIYKDNKVTEVVVENGKISKLITEKGDFDTDILISTLPLNLLLSIAPSLPEDYKVKLQDVQYLSVIEIVLELKESLSDIYWLNISDKNIPFCGIIEHTNFIPASLYNNTTVIYLPSYVSQNDPLLTTDNDTLLNRFINGVKTVFPEFKDEWILKYHIFREKNAHSIRTLNYSERILDFKTPISNFYIATDSLIYPQDRGLTVCAQLGKAVSGLFPDMKTL